MNVERCGSSNDGNSVRTLRVRRIQRTVTVRGARNADTRTHNSMTERVVTERGEATPPLPSSSPPPLHLPQARAHSLVGFRRTTRSEQHKENGWGERSAACTIQTGEEPLSRSTVPVGSYYSLCRLLGRFRRDDEQRGTLRQSIPPAAWFIYPSTHLPIYLASYPPT